MNGLGKHTIGNLKTLLHIQENQVTDIKRNKHQSKFMSNFVEFYENNPMFIVKPIAWSHN